jgi:hypothetical protein
MIIELGKVSEQTQGLNQQTKEGILNAAPGLF